MKWIEVIEHDVVIDPKLGKLRLCHLFQINANWCLELFEIDDEQKGFENGFLQHTLAESLML